MSARDVIRAATTAVSRMKDHQERIAMAHLFEVIAREIDRLDAQIAELKKTREGD